MASKEITQNLSKKDRAYLRVAVALAKTSQCNDKHGAVIVAGGRVIATGVNHKRNDPDRVSDFDKLYGLSTHAEHAALKLINYFVQHNATIYVARVNKQGKEMFSRPCNSCYKLLVEYGIKKVVYTTHENPNHSRDRYSW